MIKTIVDDVSGIIHATFLSGDWIALLIAFGSVAIAALIMRRSGQIASVTLLALVLFAIGGFVRGLFRGAGPAEGATYGDRAALQLRYTWDHFMGMQAGTLLAYFIAFMVLILVLFGVKSVLNRG